MRVINGDCLDKLKEIESNSVDSIVTDPPYGLKFMSKHWDYDVPTVDLWREALRVLKPGGHLLAFGGTRTYHRLVVNIEDAGFEIRDQIQWIYGSGFPKSMDVSKAIDKAAGVEREIVGVKAYAGGHVQNSTTSMVGDNYGRGEKSDADQRSITAPATDAAKAWQGWGTALKPANEPICLARKPLEKKLTVADNVQKHGTGALNIDASRIEAGPEITERSSKGGNKNKSNAMNDLGEVTYVGNTLGRWPANVLFDEDAAAVLDAQSGTLKSGKLSGNEPSKNTKNVFGEFAQRSQTTHGDSGGASRFFYVAKASKKERNAGLEGMPAKKSGVKNDSGRGFSESDPYKEVLNENHHPTVKPIKLMQHLVTMVTPPGGTVLDPFMGSGSTGVAAKSLGFDFIGIEREAEYVNIAEARLANASGD